MTGTLTGSRFGWGEDEAPGASREWPAARPEYTSLYAAVQCEAARWNVPGITVAVLHDGQVDEVAVGFANLDTRQPMTTATIQQIGSISKIFTTTLAMTLVDEGKLDLDEPLVTYVPDFDLQDKAARDRITLRHIFSHSAGFEGDTFEEYGRGDEAVAKAVAEFPKLRQWFQPGQLFSYNNNGFILAALAMQNVTGETFEDLMQKRVFTPLKLENTVYYAENAITYPHSVGYLVSQRADGPKLAKQYSFPRQIAAPGGIIATSRDQIRFAQMHIAKGELDGVRIISEKLATLMQTPFINSWDQYTSFGQGWYITEYPGLKLIMHGGTTIGFNAMLRIAPERNFAISVLTNGDVGSRAYEQIIEWALKFYLGFEVPKSVPTKRSKKDLDALAGLYARHDMRVSVEREDGLLKIDAWEVDPKTGERDEESRMSRGTASLFEPIESTRENDFKGISGAMATSIVQFPKAPTADDPDRFMIRAGGRVFERIGGVEALAAEGSDDAAEKGKADKKAGKGAKDKKGDKKKKGKK
ncbi:MAG: serine hydrolase domain-containing protein [Thermomicrobiales bacterium]